MIDKLSGLFTNKISEYSSYSEEEIKKIDYALAVLLGESAKLIILYILFFFLGMLDFLIFSLIILITLRSFSGGIHFDSNFMCLIFTMLFFLITSYIVPKIHFNISNTSYIFGIISFLIICIKSPRPSHRRPIIKEKRRRILKNLSIFSASIWIFVLFVYIKDIQLLNCGIATIFLLSVQLLYEKKERIK